MNSTAVNNNETIKRAFIQKQNDKSAKTDDKKPLGKDAFLTMMIAQLKNQDPMKPMDGTQFTTQLAQFSALEQALNTNTNLASIKKSLETSETDDSVFDYIGKEVTSNGNPMKLVDGSLVGGFFTTEKSAEVSIIVYDSQGNKVRQMFPKNVSAGTHDIGWDGRNDKNEPLGDGLYRFKAIGKDSKGEYVRLGTSISGIADSIIFRNKKPFLQVDGKNIDPGNVVKVKTTNNKNNKI
jgi:flagellar basal-body rod modification protein FlgD